MVAFHAEEWANKVRRYTSLTEHLVKSNPKRASEPSVIKQGEAERVLKLISSQARHLILPHALASADLLQDKITVCAKPNTGMPPAIVRSLAELTRLMASCGACNKIDAVSGMQDFVVVLDERGKDITSEGLAKLIAKVGPLSAIFFVMQACGWGILIYSMRTQDVLLQDH